MANVTRFIPKADRIKAEQVAEVRRCILDLCLPIRAVEDILILLQRHENSGVLSDWTFNMISPNQCLIVWNAIEEGNEPRTTRRVFDYVLTHIETNTGLVTLTRDELAEAVGIAPKHISTAMGRLEKLGAIIRERNKVPGMRGPGKASYRLNPHVGWNGKLEIRKEKTRDVKSPFLTLMEGGKS